MDEHADWSKTPCHVGDLQEQKGRPAKDEDLLLHSQLYLLGSPFLVRFLCHHILKIEPLR